MNYIPFICAGLLLALFVATKLLGGKSLNRIKARIDCENRLESRGELINSSIYILRNLFSELSAIYPDESEYLKRIDTVIDNMEKISED